MNASQPNRNWNVVNYRPEFRDGVIDLILKIQNVEANLDISLDQQPDLLDIESSYLRTGGGFWVALNQQGQVIGTIALKLETESVAVLKKFFVAKEHRGAATGIASALFETLRAFADSRSVKTIILDTPSSSRRSHAFYIKSGFRQIDKSEAPIQYDYPDRDSLLFRLDR
ncbi:Acetyltransferase (GNAT) family protein [Caballeronia choica]|uniref:Acetyltransferase (GNAT) family protein n=1 Tax=Caballeronia choica TaxID=326476 RepID=A0A158FRS6_9BURK|nr:GNAT family N-acetyltransferase [Caballeronia choica]SAL22515.1 Acetyltransferase (GNAT) family protein [Caballeronia choica]